VAVLMILALLRGFMKQIYKFTGPVSRSQIVCQPMVCGKTSLTGWIFYAGYRCCAYFYGICRRRRPHFHLHLVSVLGTGKF